MRRETDGVSWIAYVDESMRQRLDGSGIYVLAAAVFDPADTVELRAVARDLGRDGRPFHWRHASPVLRRKAVSTVASLDALHLVVVGMGLDLRRQERARRQCLTRLLWEFGTAGVDQAWLDGRRVPQDARDLALIDSLRARGQVAAQMRVGFVKSAAEPLVCLPDIVAGAVSSARGDGDEEYFRALEPVLTEHTIQLR